MTQSGISASATSPECMYLPSCTASLAHGQSCASEKLDYVRAFSQSEMVIDVSLQCGEWHVSFEVIREPNVVKSCAELRSGCLEDGAVRACDG